MIKTDKIQVPGVDFACSLSNKALNCAKSMFSWKGHDVSHLKDEDFLSYDNWENNLKLFSEFTVVTPVYSLMTKKIYQWLPNKSPLTEGYKNLKDQFEGLSADGYAKWLKMGAVAGLGIAFIMAMKHNLDCLDQYDVVTDDVVRDCRIHYGEFLYQPARIAQVAVATGAWAFGGWLMQNFGDFGLRGASAQFQHNRNLAGIYKITADSARQAFWDALDKGDEESAYKIHAQAIKIKALAPFFKQTISREMNIDASFFNEMMRPFDLFIEDVSTYEKEKAVAKVKELLTPIIETAGTPAVPEPEPAQVSSITVEGKA